MSSEERGIEMNNTRTNIPNILIGKNDLTSEYFCIVNKKNDFIENN